MIKPTNANEILLKIDKRILQAKNTKPVMQHISIDMRNKAVTRFQQAKDPNGKAWEQNSPVTIKRKKSSKPGTDTGRLKNSIKGRFDVNNAFAGTNVKYAPTVNYGAKKGQYGYIIKNRAPIPWGDVPGRRFLGFSGNQKKLYKRWILKHLT